MSYQTRSDIAFYVRKNGEMKSFFLNFYYTQSITAII